MPHRRTLQSIAALAAIPCLGFSFASLAALKLVPPPEDAHYVGSEKCRECHEMIWKEWSDSQHTKMMRRPDQPGVVVARFASNDTDRGFELSDVEWVIGGKWEQQFMGHDGSEETLLPGSWLHLVGEWDFTGWDGWQVPVPRRRCHGCHTVGLDPESGDFVEANIGCESCHGPSSWHVESWGFGRVVSTTDADSCGQCHARGKDKSGRYFFPVGYEPGDSLTDHFDLEEPYLGENSSHWWGNGRARERHQEFAAWSSGGHANSLRSLREGYDGRFGPPTDDCLSCHAAEAILQPWRKVTMDAATEPVTCSVCHNTHGSLDQLRIECNDCHGVGAFYHEPDRNADHVPCPESASVGCADCHMPKTALVGGDFVLHSHAPGILTPREAARWEMPSSCSNGACHVGASPDRFDAYFASLTPDRSGPAAPATALRPIATRATDWNEGDER